MCVSGPRLGGVVQLHWTQKGTAYQGKPIVNKALTVFQVDLFQCTGIDECCLSRIAWCRRIGFLCCYIQVSCHIFEPSQYLTLYKMLYDTCKFK